MQPMQSVDLKAWRERNKLTQQAAADALGISRRTLLAYEAGESDIPRAIDYACRWLDANPAQINPTDRFRLRLVEGGTVGTTEVAIAAFSLVQAILIQLAWKNVLPVNEVQEIFTKAIAMHSESPIGDHAWTQGVVGLIRNAYQDMDVKMP